MLHAPVVFDALTKPELLKLGAGRGWSLVVRAVDLNVGGTWRFVAWSEENRYPAVLETR